MGVTNCGYEEFDEGKHVAKMMIKHGGGFVQHMGEALIHADADNAERIKKAFPEYWEKYLEMSEVD
ncbi:MAG: hypothetical protein J7K40_12185 [candidate division Zixibacteria bacterium]|nr:hypothetical protein [candidate division Zixibacteria bacterium]